MTAIESDELEFRAAVIAGEWAGIFAPFEAFYIHSILYSAGRCSEAFARFDVAKALEDTASAQVSAIHEAMGHAAALSRFFWPSMSGGRRVRTIQSLRQSRASKLRDAFALDNDSPLRDRRLRDSLEHFDERLDLYLLQRDHGDFFPGPMIGDADMAADEAGHLFKLLDPARSRFVCMGEVYDFSALRSAVEDILRKASDMDRNGGRLPQRSEEI